MNRPRLPRALRITWTVFCGLACVLLIVLWVRSYWKLDGISGHRGSEYVYLDILMGKFHYSRSTQAAGVPSQPTIPWRAFHGPIFDTDLTPRQSETAGSHHILGFGWNVWGNGWEISVALWLPVLISGILAVAPWIRQVKWRFTLRTLLIATTLVAVVLGSAVYTFRK
jgi:hypothetical protein